MVVRRLKFGDDARARLGRGVDALNSAVRVTMGPAGCVVALDTEANAPRMTRDGASVAEELELGDRFAQLGLRIARRAAAAAAGEAGDGSTTATVLAQAMIRDGLKLVAAGMNPMDLKRGMDRATAALIAALGDAARPVESRADLERIATIAANDDTLVGRLVADAFDRVGHDGAINIEAGKGVDTELEIVQGIRFDEGYVSPYFMTDAETTRCEYVNPYVLLYAGTLARHESMLRLLEASVKARKPLLIVADAIEGEALTTLITSKVKGGLRVVAVKAPLFGDRRLALMEDIATMTGATLVSDVKGMALENAPPEVMGRAKRVVVTKDDTMIVGGLGDPAAVEERGHEIRAQIPDAMSDYERDYLRQRLARLTGGVAVIRAGGATEPEIAIRKERFESAINATRAAAEEGVVPGGGAALLHAGRALEGLDAADDAQRAGIGIVRRAAEAPLRRIAANAGANDAAIAASLRDGGDPAMGFDAVTGTCRDMVAAGILDAARVVRIALGAASSIAGLMITTDVLVSRDPEPPLPPLDERPFGPESPDMLPEDLDRYGLR